MIRPDTQSLFAAGMKRSLHHWLAFWQQNGHDADAQRQARNHTLRALMWCAEWNEAPETTADLALALEPQMMLVGRWAEWETCLRHVLDHIRPHLDHERRYELQYRLATLCFRLHRLDEAIALAEDNERIAVAAGDVRRQERVAILLAETYLNRPQYDTALAYAEHAVALATALGAPVREADGRINIARALLGLGRMAEAEQHLAVADRLTRAAQDAVYQCKTQLFMGHAAVARQAWPEALARFSAALALVRSYGDQAGQGVVLGNLGRALLELGRWDEASEALEEALRIHRFHGNTPAERVVQERLAELYARRVSIPAMAHAESASSDADGHVHPDGRAASEDALHRGRNTHSTEET